MTGPPGAVGPPAAIDEELRARARELARPQETAEADVVHLLPFELGGERYAVEVARVQQVVSAHRMDPLLGAPRGVLGAVLSRTGPVPVFDPRTLLGLQGGGLSDLARVVVLEDGQDRFGLAVERVSPRLALPRRELRPAAEGPFLWFGPDRLGVLDPARLGPAGPEGP